MEHIYRTFAWGIVGVIAVAAAGWTTLQIAGLPHQAHTVAVATIAGGFGVLAWTAMMAVVLSDDEDDDA